VTVLTARSMTFGLRRIVHAKNGAIARIVEERDASADERLITEINTSIMWCARACSVRRFAASVDRSEERVLPDRLIAVLHEAGHVTQALLLEDPESGRRE